MKIIYVIKYISYYKYGDPNVPIIEIYDDLFFNYYTDALNYAKTHNLRDYDIDKLNLYEDKGEI